MHQPTNQSPGQDATTVEFGKASERCVHPPRIGALLVGLLLGLVVVPGWGALEPGTAPSPAPAAAATEGPQIYPLTEVIPRSERAMARLRQLRDELDRTRAPISSRPNCPG